MNEHSFCHPNYVDGLPTMQAAPARRSLAENGRIYLALMASLCALPPLSIDMGLPALPSIGAALGADGVEGALTVSLFMAGFAATPLAYGLLSDRHGRRPLLIAGLALFALGGIGAALAPSVFWLMLARLVQGAGAGAGPTLAFAASRDRLEGARLGRRLAVLTMLLNTAPVVAPSLGIAVLAVAGWRGVYATLATGGFLLLLLAAGGFAETRPERAAAPGGTGALVALRRNVQALRSRPDALRFGAAFGLSAGSMFAYVSSSPLLLMGRFGASPMLYASLFALTASGIVAGAFLSGRAVRAWPAERVVVSGLLLSLSGPALAGVLLLGGSASLLPVVACMAIGTFGYGLVAPAAAQATLDPLPEMAGIAAALMTSFQMVCMSLSSLVAALLLSRFGGVAVPMAMIGFALLSTLCVVAGKLRVASSSDGISASLSSAEV